MSICYLRALSAILPCLFFVATAIGADGKSGWFIEIEYKNGSVQLLGPYKTYEQAIDIRPKRLLDDNVKSTLGPYYLAEADRKSGPKDIRRVDLVRGYSIRFEGSNWDLLSLYNKAGKQIAHERILRNTRFRPDDIAFRYDPGGYLIVGFRAGRNRDIVGAWGVHTTHDTVSFSGLQKTTYLRNVPIEFPARYTVKFGGDGYAAIDSKTDFSVQLKFDLARKKWTWSGWHE